MLELFSFRLIAGSPQSSTSWSLRSKTKGKKIALEWVRTDPVWHFRKWIRLVHNTERHQVFAADRLLLMITVDTQPQFSKRFNLDLIDDWKFSLIFSSTAVPEVIFGLIWSTLSTKSDRKSLACSTSESLYCFIPNTERRKYSAYWWQHALNPRGGSTVNVNSGLYAANSWFRTALWITLIEKHI